MIIDVSPYKTNRKEEIHLVHPINQVTQDVEKDIFHYNAKRGAITAPHLAPNDDDQSLSNRFKAQLVLITHGFSPE
jgi:hypothetical protein